MSDMKELKSVKIVPYTLMTSSVSAVWGLVFAIILLIFAGAFSAALPSQFSSFSGFLLGLGVAGLVVFPVGSFLLTITQSFLYALIYNLLVPKLGGIQIELAGMKEITKAGVIPFALIVAAVTAVFQFLIQLVFVPMQYVLIGFAGSMVKTIAAATNSTMPVASMGSLGGFSALGAILNIILTPIMTFIMVFIGAAIMVVLYNALAPKLGGIKIELSEKAHGFLGIDSINPVAIGLIGGAIAAVFGIIIGLLLLIILAIAGSALAGLVMLFVYAIGGFIVIFIAYALTAVFYNFLAAKIGGFEIKLE
jgi:hypothetical protein